MPKVPAEESLLHIFIDLNSLRADFIPFHFDKSPGLDEYLQNYAGQWLLK